MISAAPYSFWLLLLGILVAAVGIAHLWNRREMNAIKAEKGHADAARGNADAALKLAEKQRDGYKTEANNYRKELEKAKNL